MPKSPRVQVHAGLGKQRGGLQIVGELADHLTHRITIILGGLLQIGVRVGREALRHGLNVGLLAGRGFG